MKIETTQLPPPTSEPEEIDAVTSARSDDASSIAVEREVLVTSERASEFRHLMHALGGTTFAAPAAASDATAEVTAEVLAPSPEATEALAELVRHPAFGGRKRAVLGADDRRALEAFLGSSTGAELDAKIEWATAALDLLHEARSRAVRGVHSDALATLLAIPADERAGLAEAIGDLNARMRSARDPYDRKAVSQMQTRISVLGAQLADRRDEVGDPSTRESEVAGLERFAALAGAASWHYSDFNAALLGPKLDATAPADEAIAEFYSDRTTDGIDAADRARLVSTIAQSEGGGFDALNVHDRGGVSLGIFQFTSRSKELGRVLEGLREDQPELFERHFVDRGFDVDDRGQLTFDGERVRDRIAGMSSQAELNDLVARFAEALDDPEVRAALAEQQVARADRLVDDALAARTRDGVPLTDYLRSTLGRAHLVDSSVNAGAGNTRRIFADTLDRLSEEYSLASPPSFADLRRAILDRDGAGLEGDAAEAKVDAVIAEAFAEARKDYYDAVGHPNNKPRVDEIDHVFAPAETEAGEA